MGSAKSRGADAARNQLSQRPLKPTNLSDQVLHTDCAVLSKVREGPNRGKIAGGASSALEASADQRVGKRYDPKLDNQEAINQ
jgi:hypothetical protein